MNVLEKASMILLKLGIGDEYKKAKKEFLSITNLCLDEDKSISYYFERVLEERKDMIDMETYNILKINIKEIINYYKSCLDLDIKIYKKLKKEELKKEIECAICLSSHKREEVLYIEKCNHEFGKDCLKEWLKVSTQCPLCRCDSIIIGEYREKEEISWLKNLIRFLSIK
jgi:hypothetical protein